jgi:hypothetical protein
MNYSLSKYGREHTIFCKASNCHVLFFKSKKAALIRLKTLNNEKP